MRLIDADELRKLFKEEFKRTKQMINDGQTHLDTLAEGYAEAGHLLRFMALTVDAVPVVRCRDCKFWEPYGSKASRKAGDPLERYGGCMMWRGGHLESDFCSYGERKEEQNGRT